MNSIHYDSGMDDAARREQIYNGQLFVYTPRPAALAMCAFAREMVEAGFAPLDPRTAQFDLPVERFAEILADLKPRFIHHPRSKELTRRLLVELGCDASETYFDVPRLRTSTSGDYLTSGISYAFHPHRDTWYSAPQCQINWWFPVYDVSSENIMAFHPRYWNRGVSNSSREYNYAEWNRTSRLTAAQHIGSDTRRQPKAEQPMELDPQVRVVLPVGGVVAFSGAHMHSTVPNRSGVTRFSVDFRTVHIADVKAQRGAPNVDSECTGTTMGDYLRLADLARIPEELIRQYDAPKRAMA
ncbi:MAG: hypothetical protein ABI569_09250 [Casimicrobiaceae bacterium]